MKVIDTWLKQLHDEVGSDLFITVDAPPCIKVHGKIKPISTDLLTAEKCREIILSLMSERQKEQFRNTQELQFAYSLGPEVRYRVSAFVQQGMTGMVCRRIETRIPNFEELGISYKILDKVGKYHGDMQPIIFNIKTVFDTSWVFL